MKVGARVNDSLISINIYDDDIILMLSPTLKVLKLMVNKVSEYMNVYVKFGWLLERRWLSITASLFEIY